MDLLALLPPTMLVVCGDCGGSGLQLPCRPRPASPRRTVERLRMAHGVCLPERVTKFESIMRSLSHVRLLYGTCAAGQIGVNRHRQTGRLPTASGHGVEDRRFRQSLAIRVMPRVENSHRARNDVDGGSRIVDGRRCARRISVSTDAPNRGLDQGVDVADRKSRQRPDPEHPRRRLPEISATAGPARPTCQASRRLPGRTYSRRRSLRAPLHPGVARSQLHL